MREGQIHLEQLAVAVEEGAGVAERLAKEARSAVDGVIGSEPSKPEPARDLPPAVGANIIGHRISDAGSRISTALNEIDHQLHRLVVSSGRGPQGADVPERLRAVR